ncbi:MAG TPA: rhomboid family intramembrane serine protease [Stellaceae bacterium]|nr:rhomboid family intramembrane serine protease [Stellaceae bacterium]
MLALPLYDDTPRVTTPVATFGLVAACCAVYLWQAGLPPRAGEAATITYGMVPAVLFGHASLPRYLNAPPPWTTIYTSMFMHGGLLHLAGNMLYLWIFGRAVEMALGPLRYLVFYLVCGTVAALTQAMVDPTSHVPMIGASGAIAGVLGAYLVLNPRGNVVVFFWFIIIVRLIAVPAVFLLGIWFALQLVGALSTEGEPGVAVWAHVGGFLAGMALVVVFRRPGVRLMQPGRTAAFRFAPRRRGPWG